MLFVITRSRQIDVRKRYVQGRTETKPQESGRLRSGRRMRRVRVISLDLPCPDGWQGACKLAKEAREGDTGHLG